ncbi:hypothetical protein [Mycobacterium terramassiliense]|uniref:Mycobacterium terramassiliense ORFan n=1 Tax=Mycobacterium terramassiliense TaxID=1841859 RepID=A0A2U3NKM2_9MYCO|nr:hypothetical protein [Mycobacterium terramassiliense]SPM32036.1 Mycobacterium terramassiliense ORFan [Mycobacterium terramassiliense]
MDSCIISDPSRCPVTAQRREDGRIIVRTPGRPLQFFSPAEIDRLARFARGEGVLQRYIASPLSATEGDELNHQG